MNLRRSCLSLALCLASLEVSAAKVACDVVVRSEPTILLIAPTDSPYKVKKLDFDNGFRFAAQLLKDPLKLKTYVYFDSKDRYVLIHTASQRLEGMTCGKKLGENTVYSPKLELELSYTCQLVCEPS